MIAKLLATRRMRRLKSMAAYALTYGWTALRPQRAVFRRPRWSGPDGRGLAVCTRVKNESRFLPEFVAHHLLLGFDHVYLYDNGSTDDPSKTLQPFIDRKQVTIIPWSQVPAAPSCFGHFLEQYEGAARWVAFIDADEFVVEREEGALLGALADPQCVALGLNSRWFGSSGHLVIPDGLVMEQFRRCTERLDDHIKVLARPEMVLSYFSTHNFVYRSGRLARSMSGSPIWGTFSSGGPASAVEMHHYLYRSREDYVAKVNLGYGDQAGFRRRPRRSEWVDTEFPKHNDVESSWAAEKYGPRIRTLLMSLEYPPRYWKSVIRGETAVIDDTSR